MGIQISQRYCRPVLRWLSVLLFVCIEVGLNRTGSEGKKHKSAVGMTEFFNRVFKKR